jgi:predicted  nucleic acid-binding Zn-ribbon protein
MQGLSNLVNAFSIPAPSFAMAGARHSGAMGAMGGAGTGLYSNQALEDAVLRAERAEARALTAEKYLLDLGTPREVLAVLQRKCSEALVEASRLRAHLLRLQKEGQRASNDVAGLEEEVTKKNQELRELKERLAGDVASARAHDAHTIQELRAQLDKAGQELRSARGGGAKLQDEVGDRTLTIEELQAQVAQDAHTIEELQAELSEAVQTRAKLQDEVGDLKAVLSQARQTAKQATGELMAVKGAADKAMLQHEVQHELSALRAALRDAEIDLERARRQGSSKEQALADMEAECNELREHLQVELERASEAIAQLQEDRSELTEKHDTHFSHLKSDFQDVLKKSNDANVKVKELSLALEQEHANRAHDTRLLQARLQEEEARMWALVQRAEAAEERASAVEGMLEEAYRLRDAAQDQLANVTATWSAQSADKDAELDKILRERDAAQAKAAVLDKEVQESKAAAVESDNRRMVAEAYMKDYRALRERLEDAASAAAAARGRAAGGGGTGGTAAESTARQEAVAEESSRTCAASVFATAREADPPTPAPAPGGALDKVLREAAGAGTGAFSGVADVSSAAAASASAAAAAAADRTKTTAAAAASKVAEAASAAAAHIPEGLRDVFGNLYSSTKNIADSAGKSVADTAARLASPRYSGLGAGLAMGGAGGGVGVGFNMEEALAGLKVGLGAADVGNVRQIAGETSALSLLLAKLEEEIADAQWQRDAAEAAAVLLEDEALCLRDEVRLSFSQKLLNDLHSFFLSMNLITLLLNILGARE